jgi:hypothetical protein
MSSSRHRSSWTATVFSRLFSQRCLGSSTLHLHPLRTPLCDVFFFLNSNVWHISPFSSPPDTRCTFGIGMSDNSSSLSIIYIMNSCCVLRETETQTAIDIDSKLDQALLYSTLRTHARLDLHDRYGTKRHVEYNDSDPMTGGRR